MTDTIDLKKLSVEDQEALIMKDRPEVRAASFQEAQMRLNQAKTRGITGAETDEQVDNLVVEYSEAKEKETGDPASTFAAGQRRYVESLIEFMQMNAIERYHWGKYRAFPKVATGGELLTALG